MLCVAYRGELGFAADDAADIDQLQQLHVLGELGPTAASEQPQNCGKGEVGEGKEHRAILRGPANELAADGSCIVQRLLVSARARVN